MITNDVLEKAIIFATKKHKGQRRKGNKRPYIMHPISVMNTLYQIKEHSDNIYLLAAAAILHDTVEDCGVSLKKIAKKFGYHVASLVEELTLDKNQYEIIGKTKYLSIHMMSMSSYALCIKLCDRLDNVKDLKSMNSNFRSRYISETKDILNYISENRSNITGTHKVLISMINDVLNSYNTN